MTSQGLDSRRRSAWPPLPNRSTSQRRAWRTRHRPRGQRMSRWPAWPCISLHTRWGGTTRCGGCSGVSNRQHFPRAQWPLRPKGEVHRSALRVGDPVRGTRRAFLTQNHPFNHCGEAQNHDNRPNEVCRFTRPISVHTLGWQAGRLNRYGEKLGGCDCGHARGAPASPRPLGSTRNGPYLMRILVPVAGSTLGRWIVNKPS